MSLEQTRLPAVLGLAKETAAVASSVILWTVGLAYVLGLLIINIRLAAIGIPAPELAQPRYVVVGMLYLFLVGLTGAAVAFAVTAVQESIVRFRAGQTGWAILQGSYVLQWS